MTEKGAQAKKKRGGTNLWSCWMLLNDKVFPSMTDHHKLRLEIIETAGPTKCSLSLRLRAVCVRGYHKSIMEHVRAHNQASRQTQSINQPNSITGWRRKKSNR